MPTLRTRSLSQSELESECSISNENLFAILDACDEPLVPSMVKELGSRGMSLYSGKAAERFQDVAPYLAKVDHDLLDWIQSNLACKPWGLFLISTASIVELRRHLRGYLMVELDTRSVYFRFYDPRIITSFLKSTNAEDLWQFFGPIEKFIVPTDVAEQFVEISCCDTEVGVF